METLIPPRKKRKLVKKFTSDLHDHDDENPEPFFRTKPRKLNMKAESCYFPKENEQKDAHFICQQHQSIGVADGVGGWAKKGIDSSIYTRELMDNAASFIQDHRPNDCLDPKQILNEAFLNTETEGSSTACIITLKNNFLHAANIGDSGFLVIREGKIVYRSPIQQSHFNRPYQLGNSRGYSTDLAQEMSVEVKEKDVVVAATDGLFDNVFLDQIEAMS